MKVLPRRGRRDRLLDFHRPEKLALQHPLKPESISCLRKLSAYKKTRASGRYPHSRSAAVLVALFVGRGGDLYVLLSRRSERLRSYPGDTSLPGGKLERIDRSIENAARREAFEEIGLPLDKTKVPLLCILEPFLAGNCTIVTPVVVLITDQTLRPILNASEVQSIFSHPLVGFLSTSPHRESEPRHRYPLTLGDSTHEGSDSSAAESLSRSGVLNMSPSLTPSAPVTPAQPHPETVSQPPLDSRSSSLTYSLKPPVNPYHTYKDILWHGKSVRLHRFLTGREAEGIKPIYGLTAAILIRTAQIGYAREPEFELCAPGQATLAERIATAIHMEDDLRRACWDEGIERDWGVKEDEKSDRRGLKGRTGRKGAKTGRLARL